MPRYALEPSGYKDHCSIREESFARGLTRGLEQVYSERHMEKATMTLEEFYAELRRMTAGGVSSAPSC